MPRVLGLDHDAEGARPQPAREGVLPHADGLVHPLLQGLVLEGDVLQDLAREVPHEALPGHLQGLRRLFLHRLHLVVDHRHGLPRHDLRPQDRLLHPQAGERLRAAERYEVVGPRLQEGLDELHLRLPVLGLLLAHHDEDGYARRGVHVLVQGAAALERHPEVGPVVDDDNAADVRRAVRRHVEGLHELDAGLHAGKAEAAQLLAVHLGLREDDAKLGRNRADAREGVDHVLLPLLQGDSRELLRLRLALALLRHFLPQKASVLLGRLGNLAVAALYGHGPGSLSSRGA
mmetsp:Transcript_20275/g.41034  ORF Transcript_20275/g.41034 Transcript_20275/m.41034 type:complete len:289 (+) Transcript_20275:970-1836(+)